MYDPEKNRSSASVDVLNATKELLGNNKYAIEAIRNRNKRISDLEDIVKHQGIAFDEIEERYDAMAEKKKAAENKLKELEKEFAEIFEDWKSKSGEIEILEKIKAERDLLQGLRDRTFTRKVEMYAEKVGGKRGAMLKLLFTPPVSKIVLLLIFVIVFVASITGWEPVAAALKPLFKLFY